MMKTKETSLKKLLRPNLAQLPVVVLKQFDSEQSINPVKLCLKNQPSNMEWTSFRREILGQLESLLDIPLHSVLTRSWEKCDKVIHTAQSQLDSGLDTVSVVPLRSHRIHSQQQPQITLSIDGCEKTVIVLTINLELSLSNVVIKLQHGKIKRIISGLCKGTGTVKCGNTLLVERDIMEFHLLENTNEKDEQIKVIS